MVIGANRVTAAAAPLPARDNLGADVAPSVRPDRAAAVGVNALGVSTVTTVLFVSGEGGWGTK